MPLPSWALIVIAAWFVLFGGYRIFVAIRSRNEGGDDSAPRGLFGAGWRRHLGFGVFYIAAGAYLIAIALGHGDFTALQSEDDVPLPPAPAENVTVGR